MQKTPQEIYAVKFSQGALVFLGELDGTFVGEVSQYLCGAGPYRLYAQLVLGTFLNYANSGGHKHGVSAVFSVPFRYISFHETG